jgi:hypothetical protein
VVLQVLVESRRLARLMVAFCEVGCDLSGTEKHVLCAEDGRGVAGCRTTCSCEHIDRACDNEPENGEREISACAPMAIFAQGASGNTSVGLNAVEAVSPR